jgi:hypothetical protein
MSIGYEQQMKSEIIIGKLIIDKTLKCQVIFSPWSSKFDKAYR